VDDHDDGDDDDDDEAGERGVIGEEMREGGKDVVW